MFTLYEERPTIQEPEAGLGSTLLREAEELLTAEELAGAIRDGLRDRRDTLIRAGKDPAQFMSPEELEYAGE